MNEHLFHEPITDALFFFECKCTDDWKMRKDKFGEQVIEISDLLTEEDAEENDGIICEVCGQQKWIILPVNHECIIERKLQTELEKTLKEEEALEELCVH